jgi:hypothetical protein
MCFNDNKWIELGFVLQERFDITLARHTTNIIGSHRNIY